VFFNETKEDTRPLDYADLIRPGRLSVIDLSDTGFSELNNLVIADILREVRDAQDAANARPPTSVPRSGSRTSAPRAGNSTSPRFSSTPSRSRLPL
jgi:hypothetical protein